MIFLNVIAWIMLIISIIAFAIGTVTDETTRGRLGSFVILLGFVGTLIAYINK